MFFIFISFEHVDLRPYFWQFWSRARVKIKLNEAIKSFKICKHYTFHSEPQLCHCIHNWGCAYQAIEFLGFDFDISKINR